MGTQTVEHIAFHEAGHAVAHMRFKHTIHSVNIVADGLFAGSTDGDGDFWDEDECKQHAIALLAGYAAQVRFDADPAHEPHARLQAGHDLDAVERHLNFLAVEENTVLAWAQEFVAEEWNAIILVANQLIEHKTLDGDELSLLIDIVDGHATMGDLAELRDLRWRMVGR